MAKLNLGDFYVSLKSYLSSPFRIQYAPVWREKYLRYRYWLMTHIFSPYKNTPGFEDFEDFIYHYHKHVIKRGEFGTVISKREYARRADAMFGGAAIPCNRHGPPLGPLEEHVRACDGELVRYNNPTNELAISAGIYIGTYFLPTDGRAYFLKECAR